MANQKEKDIQLLLAAGCHIGTKSCNVQMERYVYGKNPQGLYVFNLEKTWQKLHLAARVIVAIENPQDVYVTTGRPYGQRAVLKFAHHTDTRYHAGRHTPGTFTNQMEKNFLEPRLILLCDPRIDHQPILEASYVNIPVISFCDTDSPLSGVDIAIPANNKDKYTIGVLYYILARMVLQMRGTLPYDMPWDVAVDLFFYREPEETKVEGENDQVVALPGGEGWESNVGGGAGGTFGQTYGGDWETAGEVDWPGAGQPATVGGGLAQAGDGWSAAVAQETGRTTEWGQSAPPVAETWGAQAAGGQGEWGSGQGEWGSGQGEWGSGQGGFDSYGGY